MRRHLILWRRQKKAPHPDTDKQRCFQRIQPADNLFVAPGAPLEYTTNTAVSDKTGEKSNVPPVESNLHAGRNP
jgi:hypothetical protein